MANRQDPPGIKEKGLPAAKQEKPNFKDTDKVHQSAANFNRARITRTAGGWPLVDGVTCRRDRVQINCDNPQTARHVVGNLANCLGTGGKWLAFQCRKVPVLYMDLSKHSGDSAMNGWVDDVDDHRFFLRVNGGTLSELVTQLVKRKTDFDPRLRAVVLDPVSNVLDGAEGSAEDMATMWKALEPARTKLHATVICVTTNASTAGADAVISASTVDGRLVLGFWHRINVPHPPITVPIPGAA